MGSSGCGAGAVAVRWQWCGARQTSKDKQRLGAGCEYKGARVQAYLKARFGCWVLCCAVPVL